MRRIGLNAELGLRATHDAENLEGPRNNDCLMAAGHAHRVTCLCVPVDVPNEYVVTVVLLRDGVQRICRAVLFRLV